jgi:predicted histone-like DNA-binding protein
MAYFKKKQMKSNGKWYPVSVTIGRPVGTDTVAKKLADLSSLSVGDVLSVLKLLGGVMGDYMNNGRSVKLDGVGTFYYTANAEGQGVDSPDKVGAQQITGTRVRFIPETTRDSSNKVTTRSLVSSDIFWELLDDEIPAHTVPDGEDSGGGTTEPGGDEGEGGSPL